MTPNNSKLGYFELFFWTNTLHDTTFRNFIMNRNDNPMHNINGPFQASYSSRFVRKRRGTTDSEDTFNILSMEENFSDILYLKKLCT